MSEQEQEELKQKQGMPAVVIVNTWVTKTTPWVTNPNLTQEQIASLMGALEEFASDPRNWKENTPEHFESTGIPRYYAIYITKLGDISRIIGVRATSWGWFALKWGTPPSYPYWSAVIFNYIFSALDKAWKKLNEKQDP
jgi:hypothetical protein